MQGNRQIATGRRGIHVDDDLIVDACFYFRKFYRAVAGNHRDLWGKNAIRFAELDREFQEALFERANFELEGYVTKRDCTFVTHGSDPKADTFIDPDGVEKFLKRIFCRVYPNGLPAQKLHSEIDDFISEIYAYARVMKNRHR